MSEPDRLLDAGLLALEREGVPFGDVRLVDVSEEWVKVKNCEVDSLDRTESRGLGVRVLVDGAWGYAASNDWSEGGVRRCTQRAAEIARRNGRRAHPAQLVPQSAQRGFWTTPVERPYGDVALGEKIDLLMAASAGLTGDDRIVRADARVHGIARQTWLASTEGTRIHQAHHLCGGGITAIAAQDGVVQVRSYPKSGEGDIQSGGWEFIEALDLVGETERVREEALALLSAPDCPTGRRTLIVDGAQLSLQIHESCGHPIELDRALGEEVSLAGGSFLQPSALGSLKYGSELVNITADSTSPGGAGTFGWDDEGVPASRWDIVREGQFVGYLGSRETAGRVAGTVPGAMRSDSWSRLPIVRMVNVNLAPGESTLADMIAGTEDGVLVSANRSWSIDDFRLNFQFSCEAGWEIKNGAITQMVKNPVYTGITPEFWAGCDAIGNEEHWRMWGWRFCGKGDPIQLMHVGHGCAPARFQNVEIRSSNAG